MFRFFDDKNETLVGRDTFVIALFTRDLYAGAAKQVEAVFDSWLARLPGDVLEWSCIGENAEDFTAYKPAALKRCKNELSPARSKRSMGFFNLCGGEDAHNPSYAFKFLGINDPDPGFLDQTCLVEIRWPSDYPEKIGYDELVTWVRELGSILPYRSGYASPALSRGWEDADHVQQGARQIMPLAFRHPGYDLPENEETVAFMPRDKCRGARWLTLLGPELVDQLGKAESLRKLLDPGVSVLDAGDGLLLRAGKQPEIGDVNRASMTPLLRSTARALEPVTFFDDVQSLGTLFDDDEENVTRWERRHLD